MKRRITALLAAAMLAAAAPTLAETMRIGDQAVVKKCKEYITLREADNVQATELARIPLGGQVVYLNPAKNGFALVEYLRRRARLRRPVCRPRNARDAE